MANSKEIKGRIKSVSNTKKITKAMELISTVKMKKAQDGVISSRPFALTSLKILSRVFDEVKEEKIKKQGKDLVVVVTSNKGLCGGYNINSFKQVLKYKNENPETKIDYISIGKKARDFIGRTGENLVMDFSDEVKDDINVAFSKKISRTIMNVFREGKYDKIVVIYSYYLSAISQKGVAKQFFPISKDDVVDYLTNIAGQKFEVEEANLDYKFEPSKQNIYDNALPLILDMIFYEILLESKASEHASRMVAMKNAKDNAGKKVFDLTLEYNKARQAGITKEISEIVSGVESMKDM
ncbi:MAG: ATP synthase F1 subunit gamma [Candidatus Gracilibacteria bacterium]|nr:ATP synthase F1 subunit gamma [Candidatus Gracilibacteria bacterium]MDD3120206.1 ATP synthase F1 subunit gamma [Candidatus Gracilibacteria bacterium]MDD4530675.1 ATP synthase F1 subunit gamma [Candidatus Gracilibacteria bacterium]